MIAFKEYDDAARYGMLDLRLTQEIIPDLMEVLDSYGVPNMVITSLYRTNSLDHRNMRAVDIRVWSLSLEQRREIRDKINAMHPTPEGERNTLEYWDEDNSKGKYHAHFHLRVPIEGRNSL